MKTRRRDSIADGESVMLQNSSLRKALISWTRRSEWAESEWYLEKRVE